MGQLIIRFSKYRGYPSRVVMMSRRVNPDGYHDEVVHFMHVDATSLDMGFSYPFQRESWSCCSSASQTDVVLYLLTDAIQEQIDTLVTSIEASTLDVERKHCYDRRVEKRTVCSVAKASRDSMIASWRSKRHEHRPAPSREQQKKTRAAQYSNLVSVAIQRQPDLLHQAAGQLWHEPPKKKRQKHQASAEGW